MWLSFCRAPSYAVSGLLGFAYLWDSVAVRKVAASVLFHTIAVSLAFSPRFLDLCLSFHPQKPTGSRVLGLGQVCPWPPTEYEGWVQHCLGVTYAYWTGSTILCANRQEHMKFFRQLGVLMAQLMAKAIALAYSFHPLGYSPAFLLPKDIP